MKLFKYPNKNELEHEVASKLIQTVRDNEKATLGLATGSTPEGIYKAMVEDHREQGTSYRKTTTFNLDEYVGLNPKHPQSYHRYMQDHLFAHIDGNSKRQFIPDGLVEKRERECARYDALLDQSVIDLQLLGIGQNGHVGFNEPSTSFERRTHVVRLDRQTRVDNSRSFASLNDVPQFAITMGIADILRAKRIILVATGEKKADAIKALIQGPITENLPASALKNHPNVEVHVDPEAGKYV